MKCFSFGVKIHMFWLLQETWPAAFTNNLSIARDVRILLLSQAPICNLRAKAVRFPFFSSICNKTRKTKKQKKRRKSKTTKKSKFVFDRKSCQKQWPNYCHTFFPSFFFLCFFPKSKHVGAEREREKEKAEGRGDGFRRVWGTWKVRPALSWPSSKAN